MLVVVIALRKARYTSSSIGPTSSKLVKMLGAFVVVDLYFFGCNLTAGFPGGSGSEIVAMLATSPLAPFFLGRGRRLRAVRRVNSFTPKLHLGPARRGRQHCCHRQHLLQASAAAGGRVQIPNLDYAGPMTRYAVTDWATGADGSLPGHGVLADADPEFGIRAGAWSAWVPAPAAGPQVPASSKPVDQDR